MTDSQDPSPVQQEGRSDNEDGKIPEDKESSRRSPPCNHQPPKEMPQLRFITTTNPSQGKDSRTRMIVRSHVARQYHVIRQQAWKDGDEDHVQGRESSMYPSDGVVCLTVYQLMMIGSESRDSSTPALAQTMGVEPWKQVQRIMQQPNRSLATPVGPGGTDPFSSCSLEVTPRMNILIDHFLRVVGPGINTFVTSAGGAIDSMKTIYVPFSLSDPCVFHGLLLLSARSFAQLSSDASYHITALVHKTECIRLVNEALGIQWKQTSDATIAAVLMLAVEELVLGNVDAFKTHLIGLQCMVSIKGGLEKLGLSGILQALTLSCDRAYVMYTGLDSLFEEPRDGLERASATSLPPGFHSILRSSLTNNDHLTKLISDAKATTLIKNFSGSELSTGPELQFADTHCASISQHIDRIASSQAITITSDSDVAIFPPPPGIVMVEECLSYGLLAYRVIMLRSIPPHEHVSFSTGTRLKAALARTEFRVHWLDHVELLLWVAFMGAHTSAPGDPLREWYVRLIREVSDGLFGAGDVRLWERVGEMMKRRFLWTGRCELLGRALWFEVESLIVADQILPMHIEAAPSGPLQS